MKTKKTMSKGKIAAVGAGVAAVSAGAYYLLGPNAKAHQKKAMMLASKVKKGVAAEVKSGMAKAKKIQKTAMPIYKKAVKVAKSLRK